MRLRQGNPEFEVSLGYKVRLIPKTKAKKQNNNNKKQTKTTPHQAKK
jgi:hypothetical protein